MSVDKAKTPPPPASETASFKVDAFFLKKTRLIAPQSQLRIEKYNLNVVPAVMGRDTAAVLAVLSPEEIGLFRRYLDKLHLLTLAFNRTDAQGQELHLLVRVKITAFDPVPQRSNLAMIQLQLKTLPGELGQIFSQFSQTVELLRSRWNEAPPKPIDLASGPGVEGFQPKAAWIAEGKSTSLTLLNLAVPRSQVRDWPEAVQGARGTVRFDLGSVVAQVPGVLEGAQEGQRSLLLSFDPQLMEALEGYWYMEHLVLPEL